MSRYIRAANAGVGNYGGLAHAWGFGNGGGGWRRRFGRGRAHVGKGPKKPSWVKGPKKWGKKAQEAAAKLKAKRARELVKQGEWERRKAEKEEGRKSREERRKEAKERRQEERRQEEERQELREDIEDIRARKATRQAIQQAQQDIIRTQFPGAVVPGAPLPLVMRAPIRRPMMMQMPRAAPGPVFKPRGPVKAPIITPQQARLGTLAAALASAMLLF